MSRRKRVGVVLDPTYISDWRKFRGFTLRELGKLMNLDMTALSKMERGLTPFDQIHLQQLRDILQVSIPDLLITDPRRQAKPNALGKIGTPQVVRQRKNVVLNPAAVELQKVMDQIMLPEEVDAIKTLASALIKRRGGGTAGEGEGGNTTD